MTGLSRGGLCHGMRCFGDPGRGADTQGFHIYPVNGHTEGRKLLAEVLVDVFPTLVNQCPPFFHHLGIAGFVVSRVSE